jgi:predicted short-subunit dehydrogenase-like oxidoreductase (DUF2520 family)
MREQGIPIDGVCCTTLESASEACRFMGGGTPLGGAEEAAASAPAVIIATPDTEIALAARAAARSIRPGAVVLHLSGALSSELLEPCRGKGGAIASMHPLQSFADPGAALHLVPGSVFACEGDEAAVETAFRIAERIGGKPIRIATDRKTVYHAAAAAASNFMIPPLLLALDLMEAAGLGRETGMEALKPLILGTAKNAALVGVPAALTGPIERGDRIVIERHLEAIAAQCPERREAYAELARMTVEAARRKGSIPDADADAMLRILG